MEHQRHDVQQASRMLLVHSKKLHGLLSSPREMILDRQIIHELRIIDSIKNHLLKESIKNEKWRFCGIQMSFEFEELDASVFKEIFEVKRRLLLADVYRLVFEDQLSYRLVHQAVYELSKEFNSHGQLDYLRDPLTMVVSALHEHSKNHPVKIVDPELLMSMIKNQSDYFGIDLLNSKNL